MQQHVDLIHVVCKKVVLKANKKRKKENKGKKRKEKKKTKDLR